MTAAKKANSIKLAPLLDMKFSGKVEICDFFDENPSEAVIRTSTNEENEVILSKAKEFNTFFSVQEESHDPEKAINLAAIMIQTPDLFFKNPTESILNPLQKNIPITNIIDRDFTGLDEKYKILEEIEQAVMAKVNSSSLMYDIESIADEFITNAIFHSTTDLNQRSNQMKNGKLGNIKLACTENELVISCKDQHGKLIPNKLLSRIHTCTTTDIASSINMGQGGAGIGSFLVHGMSSYYIIAVEENVQTIISSVLPLKMSNRKRLKLPKNLYSLLLKEKKHG